MVGLISIIIIIVISFAMMMEGWEKYDSQKFYTGLLVIGISIIMIFPIMQYNMENMKNVISSDKLNINVIEADKNEGDERNILLHIGILSPFNDDPVIIIKQKGI